MSRFLKVKCKCGNEQTIPEKANMKITCTVCGKTLANPTGGKADVIGEIIKVYDDGTA